MFSRVRGNSVASRLSVGKLLNRSNKASGNDAIQDPVKTTNIDKIDTQSLSTTAASSAATTATSSLNTSPEVAPQSADKYVPLIGQDLRVGESVRVPSNEDNDAGQKKILSAIIALQQVESSHSNPMASILPKNETFVPKVVDDLDTEIGSEVISHVVETIKAEDDQKTEPRNFDPNYAESPLLKPIGMQYNTHFNLNDLPLRGNDESQEDYKKRVQQILNQGLSSKNNPVSFSRMGRMVVASLTVDLGAESANHLATDQVKSKLSLIL